MRSETLVFFHVLAAVTIVGGLLATAVLASSTPKLAARAALLAAVAAFITIVLGEVTRARESIEGRWLDVASGLAYAGLLIPAVVLAVLASLAMTRRRLARWTTGVALALLAVALAVAFLMAAKPS